MKTLVHWLRESGYLQFYLFFGEMNLRYKDWVAASTAAPEPLKSLVTLFLLGESVAKSRVTELLGDEALERLLSATILVSEGEMVRANSFHLMVHRGLLYFCQMTADPFAYVGEDSLALTHYQTPIRDSRVLDLCAGPGIQSLVSAQRGNRVVAVERNEKACEVHRINLELNGLTDRVEVVALSVEKFFEARPERESFDQILFNPPLVPMPTTSKSFPAAGFGGREGLDLTETILRNYQPLLAPLGHFEFVGMTVSPRRGAHPVARLAKELRITGRLHLLSRHRMAGGAVVMEMHAASLARARSMSTQSAREQLSEQYRDCDHFFLFYARLGRPTKGRRVALETIDMSASHYGGWFS